MVRDSHNSSFCSPVSPSRKREQEDWCIRTPENFLQQMLKEKQLLLVEKKKKKRVLQGGRVGLNES